MYQGIMKFGEDNINVNLVNNCQLHVRNQGLNANRRGKL